MVFPLISVGPQIKVVLFHTLLEQEPPSKKHLLLISATPQKDCNLIVLNSNIYETSM